MSGTRKLDRFELHGGEPAVRDSRTQKLDKFVPPPEAIATPVAEHTPLVIVEDQTPPEPPRSERGRNREPQVERLRTQLAQKFTTLADEVTESFADFHIGAGAWTAELTAPEGMSTKGGKQALQHLRLRPTRQGHAVLVGGVVNGVEKTAELRDYEHIQLYSRARFGQALEITSGEWEQFLRKAEVVLRAEGITTSRASATPDVITRAKNADRSALKRKIALSSLGVGIVLAALVVWRVVVTLWP